MANPALLRPAKKEVYIPPPDFPPNVTGVGAIFCFAE
jgi:hypothetical protein